MTEMSSEPVSRPKETAPAGRGRGQRKKGSTGRAKGKRATVPPARPKRASKKASGTKQEALIAMLRRSEGASIGELSNALGWQPHTVRGAIAGALKKKLGLPVESEKDEGRGRVYRIV